MDNHQQCLLAMFPLLTRYTVICRISVCVFKHLAIVITHSYNIHPYVCNLTQLGSRSAFTHTEMRMVVQGIQCIYMNVKSILGTTYTGIMRKIQWIVRYPCVITAIHVYRQLIVIILSRPRMIAYLYVNSNGQGFQLVILPGFLPTSEILLVPVQLI